MERFRQCDVSRHRKHPNLRAEVSSCFEAWLVAAFGVECEVSEEFSGGGVDNADVEVVDEHQDGCVGVGSADADVVESTVVAEGDAAGFVDAVVA